MLLKFKIFEYDQKQEDMFSTCIAPRFNYIYFTPILFLLRLFIILRLITSAFAFRANFLMNDAYHFLLASIIIRSASIFFYITHTHDTALDIHAPVVTDIKYKYNQFIIMKKKSKEWFNFIFLLFLISSFKTINLIVSINLIDTLSLT